VRPAAVELTFLQQQPSDAEVHLPRNRGASTLNAKAKADAPTGIKATPEALETKPYSDFAPVYSSST